MVQTLNAANDVVVKLKLLQLVHSLQVVDLNDVLVGETQVAELPERHVILIIDAVLPVVRYQVVSTITKRLVHLVPAEGGSRFHALWLTYFTRLSFMTVGFTVSLSFSVLALFFSVYLISVFIFLL